MRHARQPVRRPLASALVVAAALSAPGALASAQQSFSVTSSVSDVVPLVLPEVRKYAEVLGMDEAQFAAVEGMYEVYRAAFTEAKVESDEIIDDARAEAQDMNDWSDYFEIMSGARRALRERSEAAERRFIDDVRLLLTEAQLERWPEFERTRRRLQTIDHGSLSGETVDLVALVDDLDDDGDGLGPAVGALLSRYEVELDRALATRNELQRAQAETLEAANRGERRFAPIRESMEAIREASVAVRDVNLRYARQIESSSDSEDAARFAEAFRAACYPQIYRDSYVDALFAAVKGFDDLPDERRLEFDRMAERYGHERGPIDDRWAALLAKHEAEGGGAVYLGTGGGAVNLVRTDEEDDDSPLAKAKDARRDLDRTYIRKIRGALAPELRDRLPARQRRGGGAGAGFVKRAVETEMKATRR